MTPLFPPIGATLRTLRRVPFIVWLWIVQAFLMVNASAIAPPGEADTFRSILIVYMILQLAFVRLAHRIPGLQLNLNQSILYFVGGFVATVFVVTGFMGIRGMGLAIPAYAIEAATFLIITHALVVGVAEEIIFRGALTQIITPIPAAAAFALFHFAAYGADMMGMVIAFAAGIIFYVIMRYTNIWAAVGVHVGYNLSILGVWGTLMVL